MQYTRARVVWDVNKELNIPPWAQGKFVFISLALMEAKGRLLFPGSTDELVEALERNQCWITNLYVDCARAIREGDNHKHWLALPTKCLVLPEGADAIPRAVEPQVLSDWLYRAHTVEEQWDHPEHKGGIGQ